MQRQLVEWTAEVHRQRATAGATKKQEGREEKGGELKEQLREGWE